MRERRWGGGKREMLICCSVYTQKQRAFSVTQGYCEAVTCQAQQRVREGGRQWNRGGAAH
ncbi:hypothetical protein GBAR_LOCUS17027 [Geodia barretti]|uniref:Uncharacterized protein n=1 Tax=Geodia barretti TaxID=519541 RepID=A0AA35WRF9_GEOBA|nr:hypothetical protein GBAR_LOCUS17027 [Geodia barretti]